MLAPHPPAIVPTRVQFLPFIRSCNALQPSRSHPHRLSATKRTGKQRYPSEKRKLKLKRKESIPQVTDKLQGIWRLSKLSVSVSDDPGQHSFEVSPALLRVVAEALKFPVASMLPPEAFSVARKSFDARKILSEPKFVYTVDVDVDKLITIEPRTIEFISELEARVGHIEHVRSASISSDLIHLIRGNRLEDEQTKLENFNSDGNHTNHRGKQPKVVVVGSGPAGLFATLVLAELGANVTLIERGQPVEQRGRDIGALVVRKILETESNFCFGEGGAGTWSDGKLVTRIGRNSNSVLAVMNTLVRFGAPESILINGKPHLGTDKLVPLLRNFRGHLQSVGATLRFGTRVDDLLVDDGVLVGVKVSDSRSKLPAESQDISCDALVLAVGHSARDTYEVLLSHDVHMVPKDFAVGLRIEHPQELVNELQFGELSSDIRSGRGKVPVADYKLSNIEVLRSCYSFCMCPGGQVVLTSTDPEELCVNGMSFSRRSSKWANAALVVTVSASDFSSLGFHGPLAGVHFQRRFERRAAALGGGDFTVPVQRVTDFLDDQLLGTPLPPSSYRMGVKEAKLHDLYPTHITNSLKSSIIRFDKELPGFITKEALVHGVETRTSSPVQITRGSDTWESVSVRGLFPAGEGAGYAGGIVSAAVDGMNAGFAVAHKFGLIPTGTQFLLPNSHNSSLVNY